MIDDIREQLRQLLRSSGKSKTAIARAVGMHPSAISQLLAGRSDMTVSKLAAVVEEAGGQLLIADGGAEGLHPLFSLERKDRSAVMQLATALHVLDPATRESVMAMIDFAVARSSSIRAASSRQ